MKKFIILIAVAVLALSVSDSAFAQKKRQTVTYASLSALANASTQDWGVGLAVGLRNYNRNSFVSFAPSLEVFGDLFPKDKVWGAFLVPELGCAIGPAGFKLYPHSGFILGYTNQTNKFAWGSKHGFGLDFGKHFSLDFSMYAPEFNYTTRIWTSGITWRF